MDFILDEAEARILGCFIEKEMTTPEYYPLTLNALTNACNQKSNRNPVVSYDEHTVAQAISSLQKKGLARAMMTAGSRVTKYLHTFLDRFDLSRQELAVLCELLLRGPQTVGEIRSRAERMAAFKDLEEMDAIVRQMMNQSLPLITRLPREAGRKENRYMHLLSGDPTAVEPASTVCDEKQPGAGEKIAELETELIKVREELEALKQAFAEFKSQF